MPRRRIRAAIEVPPPAQDMQAVRGLIPAPVVPGALPDERWRYSVVLTLSEVDALAQGLLPQSVIDYCRDGATILRSTPAELLARSKR
jgi:hypothetical protein